MLLEKEPVRAIKYFDFSACTIRTPAIFKKCISKACYQEDLNLRYRPHKRPVSREYTVVVARVHVSSFSESNLGNGDCCCHTAGMTSLPMHVCTPPLLIFLFGT
jgi:hypothetical protein